MLPYPNNKYAIFPFVTGAYMCIEVYEFYCETLGY